MRLHARTITAETKQPNDREVVLAGPAPGHFRPAMAVGDVVHRGSHLGDLEVLGRVARVIAPHTHGTIVAIADGPVEFGTALLRLDPTAARHDGPVDLSKAHQHVAVQRRTFDAPTSGRFYGRPGPGKDVFVAAGSELKPGTTICLLEVMKTFHRVTYSGEPAKVREVLVADGADVNAGDPLLALD
jgi:acetyl-CoA carboxylase biotin carboxyl carrier protein